MHFPGSASLAELWRFNRHGTVNIGLLALPQRATSSTSLALLTVLASLPGTFGRK